MCVTWEDPAATEMAVDRLPVAQLPLVLPEAKTEGRRGPCTKG